MGPGKPGEGERTEREGARQAAESWEERRDAPSLEHIARKPENTSRERVDARRCTGRAGGTHRVIDVLHDATCGAGAERTGSVVLQALSCTAFDFGLCRHPRRSPLVCHEFLR